MESAQEYLQHAEQCEQQAADAQLESSRVALLTAAVIWRKLAVSPPGLPEKLGQRLLPPRNSRLVRATAIAQFSWGAFALGARSPLRALFP
jgi:hypothetical protein